MGDRSKISIEMDDTLQELEVYQSPGLPHYLKSPETQIQHHFKKKTTSTVFLMDGYSPKYGNQMEIRCAFSTLNAFRMVLQLHEARQGQAVEASMVYLCVYKNII